MMIMMVIVVVYKGLICNTRFTHCGKEAFSVIFFHEGTLGLECLFFQLTQDFVRFILLYMHIKLSDPNKDIVHRL